MLDALEIAALQPQTWRAYETSTIERVIPWLRGEGAHVAGLWYTIVGALDEAVMLVRYRDLAHWASVQERLAAADAPTRKAIDERSALCHEETSKLLAPSTLARGVALDLDRRTIFANRLQRLAPGSWAEYERITATEMWPKLIPRGAEPVMLWRTLAGTANEAVLLTQYPDLAAWDGTHPPPGEVADDTADEARQRRRRLLLGEKVRLMRPSRFRP